MDIKEKLIAEAKRIEEDSDYSARKHYNARDRWNLAHLWVGLPSVLCAAIAGASAFKGCPDVACVLATISTGLTTVLTFLNPSERSEKHSTIAGQYLALRNNVRIFGKIEIETLDEKDSQKRLLALASHRNELNQSSLSTSRSDFERARNDIEAGTSSYVVDKKVEDTCQ